MKRFLLILFILTSSLIAGAQGAFTYIDWSDLPLDSIAPECYYSEPVSDEGNWKVSVKYPEYEPLTVLEIAKVQPYIDDIGEEITLEYDCVNFRDEWSVRYHFVPLVRKNGTIYKLTSALFDIEKTSSAAKIQKKASSVCYSTNSVMSTGRWVRISITEDGIYRLTPSLLAKAGFNDISSVHLYGYGGHEQNVKLDADKDWDDLPEVPLYQAPDGSLLFWGNGLVYFDGNTRVRNPYANSACYFLSNIAPDGTISPAVRITTSQPYTASTLRNVNSATQHKLIERDNYSWYHSGKNLVDADDFGDGKARSYTFNDVNHTGVAGNASLTIAFTSDVKPNILYRSIDGTSLSNVSLSTVDKNAKAIWRTIESTPTLRSSTCTVTLKSNAGVEAHLDYLALHYEAPLTLQNGYLLFSGKDAVSTTFTGLSSNALVMQLGNRADVTTLVPKSGNQINIGNGKGTFVAFDPNYQFPEPVIVGEEPNQNLHSLPTADMLIVMPEASPCWAEAQRLADAHRQYDGITSHILSVRQIYNEFSSGTPDATAIRRCAKMLYDKGKGDEHRLKYILLFGDAAWDNRMLSQSWRQDNPAFYLPSYQSENSYSATDSYVCEDYFGMVGDGSTGKPNTEAINVSVGRFPVTTAAEAAILVNKSIRHMSNANAGVWKNTAVFIGDDGEDNEHMQGADNAANLILYPSNSKDDGMAVRKVMFDTFTRQTTTTGNRYPDVNTLLNKLNNEGVILMNYTGHGAAYVISHESVLTLSDVKGWKGENLPLWFTAACDVAPFDTKTENIGEVAVLNPQGGAVAFIGTARTVYSMQNQTLNKYFTPLLFGTDAMGKRRSAGIALIEAKNKMTGINRLHYAYLGDPALLFGNPTNKVVVDEINGSTPSTDIMISSSSIVKLKGHVEDASGARLTSFNGKLTATLYDSEQQIRGMGNSDKSNPFEYKDYAQVLSQRRVQVTGGEWNMQMVTPKDILFQNKPGRLVFYAVSEDRQSEANGACKDFSVGGVGHDFDNLTEGPDLYIYLNHEGFQNGETVNATPWFYAHMKDTVDISYLDNSVGHNLMLVVDNDPTRTYFLDDYFTPDGDDFSKGVVTFNLPRLEEGPHTLMFEAWNNQNLFSRRSLSFNVNPSLKPDPVQVTLSNNPAWLQTNFIITHGFPGTHCQYMIDVYSLGGQNVWHYEMNGSADSKGQVVIPWNLCNNSGGKLSPSVYPFKVSVRTDDSEYVHVGQKIIVLDTK